MSDQKSANASRLRRIGPASSPAGYRFHGKLLKPMPKEDPRHGKKAMPFPFWRNTRFAGLESRRASRFAPAPMSRSALTVRRPPLANPIYKRPGRSMGQSSHSLMPSNCAPLAASATPMDRSGARSRTLSILTSGQRSSARSAIARRGGSSPGTRRPVSRLNPTCLSRSASLRIRWNNAVARLASGWSCGRVIRRIRL